MPVSCTAAVALGLCIVFSPSLLAQEASAFGLTTVQVVSEWRGQDRGDGSGSYHLVTTATDGTSGVAVQHELASERSGDGEVSSTEALRVLEEGEERVRGESDPSALGPWADAAATWAMPFDTEFRPDPRKNYRAQGKRVTEIVRSIVPDAKVTTKSGSDGRTSAFVEIAETQPVNVLADRFVGIRRALREAEIGLARLVLRGVASPLHAASASVGDSERP